MKVLIVDDSQIKINKIKTVINETNINTEFFVAYNNADAMSLILSSCNIDLLILDLNLPIRKNEEPKKLAGLSLLKEINKRNSINKPHHIIGLTAYTELQNKAINDFVENGWILITYDNTKNDWEDTIKNKIEYINNYKIYNINNADNEFALIMKGGGVKGLAYVGAIEVLSEYFKFSWYAGTSAGAISALLLGSGYNHNELYDILSKKNFNDFKDAFILKGLFNLITKGGFYEAKSFTTWIDKLLAKKLEQATEVKLKSLPSRVSVFASTQGKKALTFDSKDIKTNHIGAGFAARCSMSIPLFFVPQKNYGFNVFDGGMQNNYPVDILLQDNPNTKFIGLYLGSPIYEGKGSYSILTELKKIWTESIDYVALEKYKDETIIIDTRPISTLKFNLNNNEKEFLVDCGKYYALKHLKKSNVSNVSDFELNEKLKLLEEKRNLLKNSIKKKRLYRILFVFIVLLIVFYIFY